MNNQTQIAQIELDLAEARKARDLAASLERLSKNKDFNQLIQVGYLQTNALRLVHLRGDPNVSIESINKDLDAIAGLSAYFRTIRQQGDLALKAVRDGESMIEQLHAEDAE